jgi:P-type Ca2+ transporter type 2C
VRCFVKGAPDVVIGRSAWYVHPDGQTRQIPDENRCNALNLNDDIAASGERVMVVARRDFDPQVFDPSGDLLSLIEDLEILAIVGIVDPPRAEAKASIAECISAGFRVRLASA